MKNIIGIHGISIDTNKKLLLVKKENLWILPGGKLEPHETNVECLVREITEELPFCTLLIGDLYNIFFGITPHTKREIKEITYLVKITGDISPNPYPLEKIKEAKYFSKRELLKIRSDISEMTQKIISHLSCRGYL